MRMDMDTDPPPDLAIESDVTSKTTLEAYAILQVPEVWIYDNGRLMLYLLQNGDYQGVESSQIFPDLPITTWISQLVQEALTTGTSTMLRNLRRRLHDDNVES
jgi:Uma2 family endonuclease